MTYHATPTGIQGVLLLEPHVIYDNRGYFFESFSHRDFEAATQVQTSFVQDNQSRSYKDVIRGLHYQVNTPQGKLVRVVAGQAFVVAVNLQRSHKDFLRWVGIFLDDSSNRQLWIPAGFAHGFLAMSETADYLYKLTDYYSPADERSLAWNDPTIGIKWPISYEPIISEKDFAAPRIDQAELLP